MKNLAEFKSAIKERLVSEYLPADLNDCDIEFQKIDKATGSYNGIILKIPGNNISPVLNLDAYYSDYCATGNISSIFVKMAETLLSAQKEMAAQAGSVTDNIMSYDKVKDYLTVRLTNADLLGDRVNRVPHKTYGDVIMVYYAWFPSPRGASGVMIDEQLLGLYGISVAELHRDAIVNSVEKFPVMSNDGRELIASQGFPQEMLDDIFSTLPSAVLNIRMISDQSGTAGAATLFYPGACENVAKAFGGDFCVIPFSQQTAYAFPMSDYQDPDSFDLIQDFITKTYSPEDGPQITNAIFEFDSKTKELTQIDQLSIDWPPSL